MKEQAPQPNPAQILEAQCARTMTSAHWLLQTAAPLLQAGMQTVIVGIIPDDGAIRFAGTMPIDNLVVTLQRALDKAKAIQTAERQKIVLPDGTTGTGLKIG